MPVTRIEVRRSRPEHEVQAIIEAVYLALRDALHLPEDDREIRYTEYRPEHFHSSPERSENFTLIEITLFAGRSLAAKKAAYQALVRNLGELGIASSDVFIVLQEVPLENWGIRGGQAASEVDLGFIVEI